MDKQVVMVGKIIQGKLSSVVITDKFWKDSIEEAVERSRIHHARYDVSMAEVENIVALGNVISWEKVYEMVLENMDGVEEYARAWTAHPTGMEQHYGELEYKKILDECVCSRCHEPLSAQHLEWGEWEIFCKECGFDMGFVSQYHAKKTKKYDSVWAAEATKRLSGWMKFKEE